MMDPFSTLAVVGTGQQGEQPLTTATPIDEITSQIKEKDYERKVLLTAGSFHLFEQAGRNIDSRENPMQPAGEEIFPVCNQEVVTYTDRLLDKNEHRLVEDICLTLNKHQQRFPFSFLPKLLNSFSTTNQDKEQRETIRKALIPVIGKRGVWLSLFNKQWSWVNHTITIQADDIDEEQAQNIWESGSINKRLSILYRLRNKNPALAREWLASVMKQEKAENRQRLFTSMGIGITNEDEEFFEATLKDRSEPVRMQAAAYLAQIPGSAFVQRMTTLADTLIQIETGKKHPGLIVTLPESLPKEWANEGIGESQGRDNKQGWWLCQILSWVPVAHWQERFNLEIEDIIQAACIADTQVAIMHGLTHSAMLLNNQDWYQPLYAYWIKKKNRQSTAYWGGEEEIITRLLSTLPQEELEAQLIPWLFQKSMPWQYVLNSLPRPWSLTMARAFWKKLQIHLEDKNKDDYRNYYLFQEMVSMIASSMPIEIIDEAILQWKIPELPETTEKTRTDIYWYDQKKEQLAHLIQLLQDRKNILQEL